MRSNRWTALWLTLPLLIYSGPMRGQGSGGPDKQAEKKSVPKKKGAKKKAEPADKKKDSPEKKSP